jgi:hypothetical protein
MNLMKGGKKSSQEEFMFSENLFGVSKEGNLERFRQSWRQLQKNKLEDKYDDSTAVVMNESAYTVGDALPDIRGLMHIKNDLEQKVFAESRANVMIALWSTQTKELDKFLDTIDALSHEKKIKGGVFAVNVDRVFLYNEAVQKILIDKLETTFLRDSQFSNLNNLFSTRFVRNSHNAESTAPFVVITDAQGKIAFCQPINMKKIHKLASIVDNVNQGKPPRVNKKPFVDDADFDSHFNTIVEEIGELAVNNPEAMELLKHFDWKGVIAIHLKRVGTDSKVRPQHMAKFMVNLKAKEHHLKRFFEVTEFDKLRKEKWERPGFYFKVNQQVIPTNSISLGELAGKCTNCSSMLGASDPHFFTVSDEMETKRSFCFPCSRFITDVPLLYVRPA